MKIIAYKTTDLGFHYFLVLVITAIVKFILFQTEQYRYAPIGVIVIILSTVIFIHYVKVPKVAVRLKNNQLVLHNNITLNLKTLLTLLIENQDQNLVIIDGEP